MSDGNGTKQDVDLGVPIIQLFINSQNQLHWIWNPKISGEKVEEILLEAFRGQVAYNLNKQKQQSKIIVPSLAQVVGVSR